MNDYYDGTKLLSMLDINKKKPEILLCTGNRTAGKTVFFSRYLVNRFLKSGEKFVLLYRYTYELEQVSDSFFKDIKSLFFVDYDMSCKVRQKGAYCDLYLCKNNTDKALHCGYAIAINKADMIKKKSHLMSDASVIFFDEFQPESGAYCPSEINKFQSIHTSLARGGGKQYKFLPVIMVSNCITILNPYFVALGVSKRINNNAKFLRGNGFVLEQAYVDNAAKLQEHSAFNQAFSGSKYLAYSAQNIYLNDNKAFVQRPCGIGKYLFTLKYKDKHFAVREYTNEGYMYCDQRVDNTFPKKIAVTTEDHNINYVLLTRYKMTFDFLRYIFDRGCFRFSDLEAKECILAALSYV